jgi:hypothetical protein
MYQLLAVQVSVNGHPVEGFLATVVVLSGLVAAVMVLGPLLRAFARRIEGGGHPSDRLLSEVNELRDRVAELEAREARMAELEERVDFAERLLARRANAGLEMVDSSPRLQRGDR